MKTNSMCNNSNSNLYFHYLKIMCSLSNLFSNSTTPFLHYRVAENLFCKAFDAKNLSRDDISYDAKINNLGIGIKTFICKGNYSIEKIAEFNRSSSNLKKLSENELVKELSILRNERMQFANNAYKINSAYYHCIARRENSILVFNSDYSFINLNNISIEKSNDKSMYYTDKLNSYSFNYSKSTLYKKFIIPNNAKEINIEIINDPLELILKLFETYKSTDTIRTEVKGTDYVILPLYATRNKKDVNKYVPERSGPNQWNAGGRKRRYGEVYISIPADVRNPYRDFFPDKESQFNLILPSGEKLSAKICQKNGKALMTNPNVALSDWLLKNILMLKEGQLLTYDKLEKVGIDSVKINKIDSNNYEINFSKIGSYENFLSAS